MLTGHSKVCSNVTGTKFVNPLRLVENTTRPILEMIFGKHYIRSIKRNAWMSVWEQHKGQLSTIIKMVVVGGCSYVLRFVRSRCLQDHGTPNPWAPNGSGESLYIV